MQILKRFENVSELKKFLACLSAFNLNVSSFH